MRFEERDVGGGRAPGVLQIVNPDPRYTRVQLIEPTTRGYLKERRAGLRRADFDLMVLIQTASPGDAERVQASRPYTAIVETLTRAAGGVWSMRARNVKRIADVDTSPGGLFLFNHFVAEDRSVMFDLWDYLACWYRVETGLANSVAMAPADGQPADYAIVNWARWDASPAHHFWTQLSKRSFWRYVVKNLDANHAAAMPIYCRLA